MNGNNPQLATIRTWTPATAKSQQLDGFDYVSFLPFLAAAAATPGLEFIDENIYQRIAGEQAYPRRARHERDYIRVRFMTLSMVAAVARAILPALTGETAKHAALNAVY